MINNSGELIVQARLTTSWGEMVQIERVLPAERRELAFSNREGDYRVEVIFESTRRIESEKVYVTYGVNYQDQIEVADSEVRIARKFSTVVR